MKNVSSLLAVLFVERANERRSREENGAETARNQTRQRSELFSYIKAPANVDCARRVTIFPGTTFLHINKALERLYDKNVDQFARPNSACACSDCLALTC